MGVLLRAPSTVSPAPPVDGNVTYYLEWTGSQWTREELVHSVSIAYVVISILMVFLWSAYLCYDGRKAARKNTHVIHMLVERTRAMLNFV
ncbi:unnamed protein product, partial [Mesorhabditis spiculigera]